MKPFSQKSQSVIEYSILIVLVIAGILLMTPYVIRAINAHMKGWEDSVSDSFNESFNESFNYDEGGSEEGSCDSITRAACNVRSGDDCCNDQCCARCINVAGQYVGCGLRPPEGACEELCAP